MEGTISAEMVSETWQWMSQIPISGAPQMVEQMKDEQPVVVSYMLSLVNSPFNTQERKIIAFLGMVVWQNMKQSTRRLNKVTRRKLRRAEDANSDELLSFASDTGSDLARVTVAMLEHHPEPEVLRCLVKAIAQEEPFELDGPPIRDEYQGLAFMHLKIVLDAFVDSLA
jgi:hypothetical protein